MDGLSSVSLYLAEGSRFWMVVMKMSTMKAHTRLDLNTSSLIWEYCSVTEGEEEDEKEEEEGERGKRKGKGRRG